jgi:hypothetical protein
MTKGTDIELYSFTIGSITNFVGEIISFFDQLPKDKMSAFVLDEQGGANLKRNPGTQSGMNRTFRIYVRSPAKGWALSPTGLEDIDRKEEKCSLGEDIHGFLVPLGEVLSHLMPDLFTICRFGGQFTDKAAVYGRCC